MSRKKGGPSVKAFSVGLDWWAERGVYQPKPFPSSERGGGHSGAGFQDKTLDFALDFPLFYDKFGFFSVFC